MATPTDEIRSQYLHRAYLLQSQVDNGTWVAAERTARELIPLAREVASTRTAVILRSVSSQLAMNSRVPSGFTNNFRLSVGPWTKVRIIMPTDREIAANADPEFEQHFLVSADKLAKLISAAGIRPTDDVLEVGAGIVIVAKGISGVEKPHAG